MYVTVLSALITTAPCAPCVTAVTEGMPSNVSLPSTAIVTAVSFLVAAVSATISATAATVTVITAVSMSPPEVAV